MHPYKAFRFMAAAVIAVVALQGCSTLQSFFGMSTTTTTADGVTTTVPTTLTFNQKLAIAYGLTTQVRESAAMLLDAGKIKISDAQDVQVACNSAVMSLNALRVSYAADPLNSNNKLAAINATLTALSAYLATKQ